MIKTMKFTGKCAAIVAAIALAAGMSAGNERRIAITFDDLPATRQPDNLDHQTYVTNELLRKLKESKIKATGFVNEYRIVKYGEIDARAGLLEKWLEGGHELGNHTFSHIAIDRASFEEYAEDVVRGETITRMLLERSKRSLRYFRHTQLRTGPTEEYRSKLNRFLGSRGYTVAPVTIDNNDYIYTIVYSNAKRRGDKELQDRIVRSYVEYMEQVLAHFERISFDFLGREMPHVLLLHANEINADHFDKLAQMMRRRGYQFVSLEEALSDEAYSLPEAVSTRGLSWIHRWMLARGLEMKEEPSQPDWINQLFRQR